MAQDSDLTKVLDLGACKGDIGQGLAERGLTNIFGHEGSENKKQRLLKKGAYRDIETFIVGKQSIPLVYKRKFDIVTCSENLGTNLFPVQCF